MFKKKRRRAGAAFSATADAVEATGSAAGATGGGPKDDDGGALVTSDQVARAGGAATRGTAQTSKKAKKAVVGHSHTSSKSAAPATYGGGAFAMNELAGSDADKLQAATAAAAAAADSDTATVNSVLAKSRARAGKYGPFKAPTNLRSTVRIDYAQDVCKDYKETGYCGYGDNCIYMHDRGNYKTGDQLDKEWDLAQAKKARDMSSGGGAGGGAVDGDAGAGDGPVSKLPFACHICREEFTRPVVTLCDHYFCQKCAFANYAKSKRCAVCNVQTKGVFNAPGELFNRHLAKAAKAKAEKEAKDAKAAKDAKEAKDEEDANDEEDAKTKGNDDDASANKAEDANTV